MKKIGIDLDGVVFDSETMFMTEAELYDVRVLHRNSLIAPEKIRLDKGRNGRIYLPLFRFGRLRRDSRSQRGNLSSAGKRL